MESGLPVVVVMLNDGRDVNEMDVIARDMAKSLKCSHICLDDIIDNKSTSSTSLGMDRACRIAISQLRSGQSVLINCLTSFSQFSMLKPLYDSPYSYSGDALVILHCHYLYPTQEPSSDEESRVSRLMVDTFGTVNCNEVIKALKDLAYCNRGHVEKWSVWRPFHGLNDDHRCDGKRLFAVVGIGGQPYNNATHAITEFKQVRHGAYCGACRQKVSGEAYTCRCGCNVVMHKKCQQLSESEAQHSKTPKSLIQLVQLRLLGGYLFPEPRRCKQCKAAQKEFSYGCQRCLSETQIKYGLPEKISLHNQSFVLQAITIPCSHSYRCEACGKPGSYAGYSCFRCDKHYHVGCVFMPLSLTHRHGGWEHQMDLQFKSAEDEEGTFCDFCLKDLDPNFWFYACKEGGYLTHVECVFSDYYDQGYVSENEACALQDDILCNDRHITSYFIGHEVEGRPLMCCIVCGEQISRGSEIYACQRCSFALHASCAEASEQTLPVPKFDECSLAFWRSPVGYPFVKSHLCPFCQDNPSSMPYECGNCIFEANLKHKEWPPLLHHKGHDQHHLSFWAMSIPPSGQYNCVLCRKPGTLISYKNVLSELIHLHVICVLEMIKRIDRPQ